MYNVIHESLFSYIYAIKGRDMIQAGIIEPRMYRAGALSSTGRPSSGFPTITSRSYAGQSLNLSRQPPGDAWHLFSATLPSKMRLRCDDTGFIALPHGLASNLITAEIRKNLDYRSGADYRLKSRETYEQWYAVTHHSPELLDQAVYGLCEWNRTAKKAHV